MRQCLKALSEQMNRKEDSILVTVVGHEGSTPRGTGSMMVVSAQGRLCGTIGGGAIEWKAIRSAMEKLGEKRSWQQDFSLDLRSGTDLGMVCGGSVSAYFSFVGAKDERWQNLAAEAENCFAAGREACLMISLKEEKVTLWDGENGVLAGDMPEREPGQAPFCGSIQEQVFVMPLPLGERVVVFGGGHVAQALVPVMAGIGFRVTVFENRKEFADPRLFPSAEAVLLGDYGKVAETISLTPEDYIVIMTSGHMHDYIIEEQLLREQFTYIGVMGSRKKIASVNARLAEAGITEEQMKVVHTPIGLSIKAVTPAEIAISVAAECIEVRALKREAEGFVAHGCPAHE